MNDQERMGVFCRFMIEGFQAGNPDLVDELISEDVVDHQVGTAGTGLEVHRKVKWAIVDLKSWLPDLEYTFDDMHCVGDTVWARLTARGTNLGSVFGKPPTGRSIEITVMEVARIDEHGQMVEHWGVPDRYALLAQLGLLDNLFAGIRVGAAAH
jgi:predicted ester cyclase